MNCQEALSLLYDIIDKEASEIDTRQVQEHLSRCRDCFDKYELEQSIQGFIQAKLENDQPALKLDGLRAKIAGKLDAIDGEARVHRRRSPFRIASFSLAAAALLVVMIGAASLISDFVRHNERLIPLERAHWSARENPQAFSADNPGSALIARYHDNLRYELHHQVNDFTLVGAMTEEIMGVEMGHFVYSNNGSVVSVFVAPADRFDIPGDLKDNEVVRNNLHFFDHNCRGCRLVFHQQGSVVIITATNDTSVELLEFIPGHMAI
ncbi:MAG: zf-HC2 domain-containing protein [candidate division Zixibacteria bacterium]|nr:zf-HC2 domain-containing protein [candidate division Zixibacteria bacterium]